MTKQPVSELDKLVGSRIRNRRLALGWSMQKLGDAVGLTHQSVQKWEAGKGSLTITRLVQVAEVLRLPPSSLIGETVEHNDDDEVIYAFLSESIAFTSQLRRIKSTKVKRQLLNMLKAIADELEVEAHS
ncbi:helix-turn-helix transcriptional regulator [Aquamicrobium lusatiense]|uniref:helix-turn-helix domain-containing protein n=1 Tax=Aquamicrobium lusatiense TaxID=89772 RepID=UPI002456189A|nr:helix-turn-helix transcriptional regulator [Aquamicrobium lusatiense]MDH4992046.1 helix-turn-helix transcriptional regulator [Aquamicrobium lusatiense]